MHQVSNERRPAGLVAGADAGSVIAVEILVEQDEVAPMGVVLEDRLTPENRTAPPGRPGARGAYMPASGGIGNHPCV